MLKEQIGSNGIREYKFDGKDMHVKTTFHDDKSLDTNEDIRRSGMLEKAKLGLHDDEDIRFTISCPSTLQWMYFKRDYPEIYEMLVSKDEALRMEAAKKIQILNPLWVCYHRF